MTLALNLAKTLRDRNGFEPLITKADIAPQDMSFQDAKLERLKKMMRKHPGKNPDWDPEIRTHQLAQVEDVRIDPTTSRQVRRQVKRLMKKALRTHKFGKKVLDYNSRVHRAVNKDTGLISHHIVPINRPSLTHVDTSRYVPHQGKGIRYASNFQRATV
jgi:hypothetical protein